MEWQNQESKQLYGSTKRILPSSSARFIFRLPISSIIFCNQSSNFFKTWTIPQANQLPTTSSATNVPLLDEIPSKISFFCVELFRLGQGRPVRHFLLDEVNVFPFKLEANLK